MLLGDFNVEFYSLRFQDLKLEDSDCDWIPQSDLKIECQLISVVELNILSFNSYHLIKFDPDWSS